MANYRQIHTRIWKDDWFSDLTPDQKILFIYLFSNEASSFTGIYALSLRVMAFETGLDYGEITDILYKFEQDGKVYYRDGIVWVVKMWQYHKTSSDTIKIRFNKDLELIPDRPIKRAYQYYLETGRIDTDTLSIAYTYTPLKKERIEEKEVEGNSTTTNLPTFQTGSEASAERVYNQVTGHVTIPSSDRLQAVNVIVGFINRYGEEKSVEVLRPFWQAWRERKYKATNLSWLTGWAVTGEIPEFTGNSYQIGKSHQPTLEEQGYTNVTQQRLNAKNTAQ